MSSDGRTLFENRLFPMTRELAFLEAPSQAVVDLFAAWHRRLDDWRGVEPVVHSVAGDLESALLHLPPLTTVERRRSLFVPTASPWTAYFDNGHRGPDPVPPVSYLAKALETRWIRVVADVRPSGSAGKPPRVRELIFEYHGPGARFGPDPTDKRILDLTTGGRGRRTFRQIGHPLPFERVERYEALRPADRFDLDLMREYLLALDLRPFDEAFYMPDGTAQLVEKVGPRYPHDLDWSLEEARQFWLAAGDWTAARTI
jgi:hypothetical protein